MDRVMVYDGALPQTTDVLNSNKFALVAQAFQDLALLGASTVVAGLTCTPTTPTASLNVVIGSGSIYQMDPTDATAYGDLGTDNNNILKQGILASPVTLLITPPATAGFSQVYLVQAILSTIDAGASVLSYFNSANPTSPFSGPANAGTSNFTVRTCQCSIALKAGVPAATGSQTTPAPDLGFTALYAITVVNAQTQITSPNIVQVSTAPFFPTLPSVPGHVFKGDWVWGTDTGAANAYVVTVPQTASPLTAYAAGMGLRFKALNANSGAGGSTINVNGFGVVAIKRAGGATLAAGDILSGQVLDLVYDGVSFQMANYLGISAGSTTNNFSSVNIPYVADTGTTNALIATYSPAVTSGLQVAGLFISVKIANNITGPSTINVNGLGVKTIDLGNLTPTPSGVFVTGEVLLLVYDGTQYQIVSSGSGGSGPAGPAGPAGGIGPQGVAGSFPIGAGIIGSYAFTIVGLGSVPGQANQNADFYPGTWSRVSTCQFAAMGDPNNQASFFLGLAQRIA